ncbi:MAG TPA: elongation factor Ts, partial [Ruminococcaceae bacterium]|nr:elongation factor Ts [Oscillospiraceae bacterium]
TEQVINDGKPAAIAEKIVVGRLKKFYKEICLVDQPYVKDGDLSVQQYTDSVAKELGGKIAIQAFVRYEKGEGIEKRSDNFADEVAGMIH